MKAVLVITYYWPPSGGIGVQRWVKFSKYLPELGIDPIVLTVKDGTYPHLDQSLVDEISVDQEVYQAKSIEPYAVFGKLTGKSGKEVSNPSSAFSTENESITKKLGVWLRANVFIPDARLGWVPFASGKAEKIIKAHQIETVITTGPPNSTHIVGRKLKKKFPHLKWIMDMRDPWSKIFYNEMIPRSSLADWYDAHLEKSCLSKADEVIVVSDSMNILQRKVYDREYRVITNGFDHTDFEEIPAKEHTDKLVIKYVGSMTEASIPYPLFDAIKELDDELRARISIEFYGSFNGKVISIIREQLLDDVISFHGYLPHLVAKKEMQKADVLLLVIPNTENNELIITGKIFDYIAAQNHILYIGPDQGDAAKVIRECNIGSCFDYKDADGIKSFLLSSLTNNKPGIESALSDLKNHPYSRYTLTQQLAELIGNS